MREDPLRSSRPGGAANKKRKWFLTLARRHVRRQIRRQLDGVFVRHDEPVRALLRTAPVLFVANHASWWDPLILVALDEALGTDGFALMEVANLRRNPFFSAIGAIPLDPALSRRNLRQGAALLDRPGRCLWVFPQGRIRPSHLRPLGFRPGVRILARLADVPVVPVSLSYAFQESPNPSAFVSFGAAIAPGGLHGSSIPQRLEAEVTAGLDEIDASLTNGTAAFAPLIPTRIRHPQESLSARILARLPLFGSRSDP